MKNLTIYSFLCFFTISIFIGFSCKKDSAYKVRKNHRKSVGTSANDLLSNNKKKKLIVEIQYMSGFRPTDQAIANLSNFLNARLNKSDGISIVYSEIPRGNKASYSIDDVVNIEDENRKEFTTRKEIAAYFLFLDGEYAGNSGNGKVLGIAYFNTSMVIFEKTIQGLTDQITEPERFKLESTVINHEFGHILGLVNIGTNMQTQHQDVPNGNHCDNEDCLMHWTAETGGAVDNLLGGGTIPGLDQNCINDLRANGGK